MKRLFKITPFLVLLAIFSGCTESKTTVDDVYDNVTRGAVFRSIALDRNNFNMFYPETEFSITAEVDDNNKGALLDYVDVYVSFVDNKADGNNYSKSETLFTTIDASEFSEGPNGFPAASFSTTLGELVNFMGLTLAQYNGGDVIPIRFEMFLTDGRRFSSDNVASTVSGGSFFRSPFRYNETIAYGVDLGFSGEGKNIVDLLGPEFNTGYQATVSIDDEAEGALIATLNVYKRFDDNTISGGVDISQDEALFDTYDVSTLTLVDGVPTVDLDYSLNDILGTIDYNDLGAGDAFYLRYELITADGRNIYISGDYDKVIPAIIGCAEPLPTGDWTVVLNDSYGDGWQTTGPNGGPGLTITLDTGDVFEIGLCTPYEANSYACTAQLSTATVTVTIPEAATSAQWFFPGDYWGEISVQIFTPDGTQVGSIPSGSAAGNVAIDLCK